MPDLVKLDCQTGNATAPGDCPARGVYAVVGGLLSEVPGCEAWPTGRSAANVLTRVGIASSPPGPCPAGRRRWRHSNARVALARAWEFAGQLLLPNLRIKAVNWGQRPHTTGRVNSAKKSGNSAFSPIATCVIVAPTVRSSSPTAAAPDRNGTSRATAPSNSITPIAYRNYVPKPIWLKMSTMRSVLPSFWNDALAKETASSTWSTHSATLTLPPLAGAVRLSAPRSRRRRRLTTEPVAEHDGPSPPEATTARRRPSTSIRLCPPQVVPISEEDYQAITALATMIASWWREQHNLHNDDTDAGQ